MRKLFLLLATGMLCVSSLAHSQARSFGTKALVLDDGLGHTVTIQPTSPSATYTWTLPAGAPPANVPGGTVLNSTLRWNGLNWVENTSFLANAGALSASSLNLGAGALTAGASTL